MSWEIIGKSKYTLRFRKQIPHEKGNVVLGACQNMYELINLIALKIWKLYEKYYLSMFGLDFFV